MTENNECIKYLQHLSLLRGEFINKKLVSNQRLKLLSNLSILIIISALLKFGFCSSLDKKNKLNFYFGDAFNYLSDDTRNAIFNIAITMFFWSLLNILIFYLLFKNSKMYYWVLFLNSNEQNIGFELSDLSKESFGKYLIDSNNSIKKLKIIFFILILVIIFILNFNYHLIGKDVKRVYFWIILILNIIHFFFAASISLQTVFSTFFFLVLIANLLNIRYLKLAKTFTEISNSKIDSKNQILFLNKQIYYFKLVCSDLFKINRFWSIVYGCSFFIGLGYLVYCAFVVFSTESFQIKIAGYLMVIVMYVCLFFYPLLSLGNVSKLILKSYNPLMKILVKNDVPILTKLKIIELIEFIDSDRSGITCFQLFVIKKSLVLDVTISLISNLILSFDIYYNWREEKIN